MKSVRFSTDDLETIVPTYSNLDYDRGSFSMSHAQVSSSTATTTTVTCLPLQHNTHNNTKQQKGPFAMKKSSRPFITPLDLSGVPNACRRSPAPIGHQVLIVSKVSSLMIH